MRFKKIIGWCIYGLPERKSIRLKDYDYSQAGYYFITICTQDRLGIFGEIVVADDRPCLPTSGNEIKWCW
ncbi:hypothetical protein H8707_00980 [Tissierellaceae bacterium BX21]|uniref:Transposase n=1 Tax=Paratissierella segnis TaxID=2763679 RepID=A0A926IJM3_9FIRM|nr:hypothetical protein [Paratissierella segnis]